MKRLLSTTALLLVGAITFAQGPPPDPGASPEFVPGQILIKRVDRITDVDLEPAKRRVDGTRIKAFPSLGIELWRLGPDMPVGRAVAELQRAEFGRAIEFVEPNWLFFAHETTIPTDPRLPELWGMLNVGQTGGTPDADIDAPEAWSVETGSTGLDAIVIGVIDTGVDYLHEDLAANIWVNPNETLDGVDSDGNGYIDDIRGWDFLNEDNDPMDDNGHGTHTSGTIGAVGDNGVGVTGVNWSVKIMPLKFLNAGGRGTTDDAIEAVLYAASFGVPITNNSWGGGRKSRALESAIASSDSLFVASAGNTGNSRKQYPAGYDLDNILSVAATDHDDLLASFSSYGESWVDLAAPGVEVLSTVPDNGYDWGDGTSMAAPHVAGVAGLVMAAEPAFTWVEVKERILAGVDSLPSLAGLVLTGGRLNAAAALGAPQPPPEPDTSPPAAVADLAEDPAGSIDNTVSLTWTAPGDDGNTGTATLYDVRYSASMITEATFETATEAGGEPQPQPAGSIEIFAVTDLPYYNATYYFALKSLDEAGNVSAISNNAEATTGPPPPPESLCADGLDNDSDGAVDCADFDCVIAGPPDCPSCGNNVCELGESCGSCFDDCSIPVTDGSCGDGICQAWNGEDCESCPADCNGLQTGKPSDRFCCGGGRYRVDCTEPRCTASGWECEDTAPQGACCGDEFTQPELETEWTCGIEVCGSGTAGADPALFLISYYYDGAGPYDDLTTLGAGSTYTIHNAPGGWYGYPDIAECQVNCANEMRAYNHDSVSAEEPGEYGTLVSLEACSLLPSDATCCSTAIDQGLPGLEYSARCCFIP